MVAGSGVAAGWDVSPLFIPNAWVKAGEWLVEWLGRPVRPRHGGTSTGSEQGTPLKHVVIVVGVHGENGPESSQMARDAPGPNRRDRVGTPSDVGGPRRKGGNGLCREVDQSPGWWWHDRGPYGLAPWAGDMREDKLRAQRRRKSKGSFNVELRIDQVR